MNSERNDRQQQLKRLLKLTKEHNQLRKPPFYTLQATRKRMNIVANYFRKAYRQDSKVVYRSVIMPTEIFFAMDMVPVCVETVSAMLAGSNLSQYALNIAEQNHYSRDLCSFSRCALGAAIDNFLPAPDFLACTSYYCDDTAKLFFNLSKIYEKDYFLLDIPYDYKDEESIEYLAGQLKKMVVVLEEKLGKKLDPDRLREAIRLSNQAREYFVKVNELRTAIPAPISGGEAIDYAALLAFTWGSKEMVEICKALYEEIKERVATNSNLQGKKKPRIFWRHLRPYYNNSLLDFIENECNVEIAFEDINHIHWEAMNLEEPYRSLARKLIYSEAIGPVERYIDGFFILAQKYQIDGVISFVHWGCRHLGSINQMLKDDLDKRGIPSLEIGGDCIDNRDYSFAQLRTRIQAFLEMMGGKKR